MKKIKQDRKSIVMDLILMGLIVLLIGVIVFFMFYMDANSISCLVNPVEYYETLENVSCSCSDNSPFKLEPVIP